MVAVSFGAVATLYRTVLVLFCVGVGTWLWMRSGPSRLSTSAKGLSDVLFPVPSASVNSPWVRQNHLMLQSMLRCIEHSDCRENQAKVVLISSFQFRLEMLGQVSGEMIWARSTVKALRNMGYTFLYTSSLAQTVQLYQTFPDLVKAIIGEGEEASDCFDDKDNCALSTDNPTGIPPWKFFSFAFWGHPANPLGSRWTLSPENYKGMGFGQNTYLGYSIEDACRMQPFIPHSQRENQAYILAKLLSFLTPERDRAWAPAIFDAATHETGIKYIIAAINDTLQGEWPAAELPSNHEDLGLIGQATFLDKLSRTRVLIGIGNPAISPTPYDALCLGVPFINPILNWDRQNSSDKSQWTTQHPVLEQLEPPYVYNVFRDDLDGFVQAIKNAISHPIESYILEPMRMSSVEKRFAAILEHDWQSEAALQES